MVFNGINTITYSRLFLLEKRWTVREVKKRIFIFFRSIITVPDNLKMKRMDKNKSEE